MGSVHLSKHGHEAAKLCPPCVDIERAVDRIRSEIKQPIDILADCFCNFEVVFFFISIDWYDNLIPFLILVDFSNS